MYLSFLFLTFDSQLSVRIRNNQKPSATNTYIETFELILLLFYLSVVVPKEEFRLADGLRHETGEVNGTSFVDVHVRPAKNRGSRFCELKHHEKKSSVKYKER